MEVPVRIIAALAPCPGFRIIAVGIANLFLQNNVINLHGVHMGASRTNAQNAQGFETLRHQGGGGSPVGQPHAGLQNHNRITVNFARGIFVTESCGKIWIFQLVH